jgi:hypothetical protein
VERHADGITIAYPPLGLVRGGGFIALFALIWNVITLPLTGMVYYQAVTGAPVFNGAPARLWWYLFPLPFLLVGAATALAALHLARRRAGLAVVGDSLMAMKGGLFGSRRGEWKRRQVTAVQAAPSGFTQNDQPLLQLEIQAEGQPRFTLLAGRPDAEIEWLATALRQALQLPPAPLRAPKPIRPAAPVTDGPARVRLRSFAWIGATLGGAMAGTVLYFAVDQLVIINGVGLVQRFAAPTVNAYTCAAVGAGLGLFAALLQMARRKQYVQQLIETCQAMGFAYSPNVQRDDLGDFQDLPLFRKWSAARDRMSGTCDGVPVELIDYTSVDRGGESSTYYRRTVALLPAPEGGLPSFELQPRDLAIKLIAALLTTGIAFDPSEAETADDREVLERFGRSYFLSAGIDAAAIRRLFTMNLLAFFADHPGWHVESDGRHLALHRSQVIAAAGRPAFVADAVEVHRALASPGTRRAPTGPAPQPARSGAEVAARGLGTIIGVFVGFFLGGMVGMGIIIAQGMGNPAGMGRFGLIAAIFFGCPILGMVIGALVGNRLLSRPLATVLGKRKRD